MDQDTGIVGLTEADASRVLRTEGFNELPTQKKYGGFRILLRVLSEPMLLILLFCALIYTLMGDLNDALMMLVAVIGVVGITFHQERKTERTLEALRDLTSPRALVIRDGSQKRIAGREVVRGDTIMLHEGDRIPADASVLHSEHLFVDESLLTGESVPVEKTIWDGIMEKARPGGSSSPFVYSGSLVVSGRGIAQVTHTGINTEIGIIGKSVTEIVPEESPLQKEIARLVRGMAFVGVILCVSVVIIYTFGQGNIMDGLLAGLTLGMAILPEEFPVVLTIFLTLGAWRISQHHVLTRRSTAIETLGAATVLCTDKTGTITMNKTELATLYTESSFFDVRTWGTRPFPEHIRTLLSYGMFASKREPYDPIEKELLRVTNTQRETTVELNTYTLLREYPLSKDLLAITRVWRHGDTDPLTIATKGAPEAVLSLCHADRNTQREVEHRVRELSKKGMRVLGVARATYRGNELPTTPHEFNFAFVGLLGFMDPIREGVKEAVEEATTAGIRVVMITGDHPATATCIARQIGITNPDVYLTGNDLTQMDTSTLRKRIQSTQVFARVLPEQKLLIVNALKKGNGEVTAMTGDGVNDAPALKSAHIGIAMGERGTDVAREASALVLLNDDFSSIVQAIQQGRRIYDNITRAIGYIIAVHVPIAGMSVLPLISGSPIVLFPAHIAFLELIIDPACSMVFEAEKASPDVMKRPPRNIRIRPFTARMIVMSILQGFGILCIIFGLYYWIAGNGEQEARAFAFSALVITNIILITANLSWQRKAVSFASPNRVFLSVSIGAITCLSAVLFVPALAKLFHVTALKVADLPYLCVVVFATLVWLTFLRIGERRFFNQTK